MTRARTRAACLAASVRDLHVEPVRVSVDWAAIERCEAYVADVREAYDATHGAGAWAAMVEAEWQADWNAA